MTFIKSLEVSLVFPAYNEYEGLEKAVHSALERLQDITPSFEIIIAEDGSTDGTDDIADRLASSHPEVRHLHSTQRLGRGRALNKAFKESRGNILVYMDVDLATDITQLGTLVEAIRNGADLATGSRMLSGSRVTRSTRRSLASHSYNLLINMLFCTNINDHQCGFKAFNRTRLLKYIDEVEDNHWFWDTEVLIRGSRLGYRIVEIPVIWVEGPRTKVNFIRDSWRMGSKAISLWWKLH